MFQLTSSLSHIDLPSLTYSTKLTSKNLTDTDSLSIKSISTFSSPSSSLFWRRRQNCCTNFYAILFTLFRRNEKRRKQKTPTLFARKSRLTQSVGGDFVYTNAYEVLLPTPRHSPNSIDKTSTDLYFLGSESLNITPPPLPQRNMSQSSDSITPQPRPDIGRCSSEPPMTSPTPPPLSPSDSGIISKWPEKYRKTLFTNSNFEPLLEEDLLQGLSHNYLNSLIVARFERTFYYVG